MSAVSEDWDFVERRPYIRIRSWHLPREVSTAGFVRTLCGKVAKPNAPRAADFGNDPSCESCLRIARKRGE